MKPRLIIHLGLPKTGSTSLQTFLRENAAALADAGIHYPKVREENADHKFFRAAAGFPYIYQEISHAPLAREIKRREGGLDPAAIVTPLWSTALRRIHESGARAAIISYEHFSTRPELYRFEPLRPRLRDFDVAGVIYLRNHEDWASSLYGQFLRRRTGPTLSFSEFIASPEVCLRFSNILDAVTQHFPLDELLIGDFATTAENGLFEDFFTKTRLPMGSLAVAGHRSRNKSLTFAAALFLLRLNRSKLPATVAQEVRKALDRAAARNEIPRLNPGLDVATPAERQAVREVADSDADRLRRRYGVVLAARRREPEPFRPFDAGDFAAVAESIGPRLSPPTRELLVGIGERGWQ